jgi:hypothetical protein
MELDGCDLSIALTVKNVRNQLLPKKVLKDLYRWPLIPPRRFVDVDGRTRAIRQIRRQAGGEGITNAEYVVLTACHLLKFAAQPGGQEHDNANLAARRGLCYLLACNLIQALATAEGSGN